MILVNGVAQTTIAVADRGLQYGDGLFETIALCNGELELWGDHMERLQQGAERLLMQRPDVDQLFAEAQQLTKQAAVDRGVVKIILTRGEGGRGYRIPDPGSVNRIVSLKPWPYSSEQQLHAEQYGVKLHICHTRLGENPTLAGIKHLNRLEQVLARSEWSDDSITEGVVMNHRGEMIEGTMSNLFFVRDGAVITPDLSSCGVAGVMRKQLLRQFKRQGIDVEERAIPLQELVVIDEAFCCNSLIGIWPIAQMGGVSFPAPGIVTRDCIQRLKGGS